MKTKLSTPMFDAEVMRLRTYEQRVNARKMAELARAMYVDAEMMQRKLRRERLGKTENAKNDLARPLPPLRQP